MNRDNGTLHINQIILAQLLSFPSIKDCATFGGAMQTVCRNQESVGERARGAGAPRSENRGQALFSQINGTAYSVRTAASTCAASVA
jgi:hypothetical protein